MSEQLTARFRTALGKEVEVWRREGLVSDKTADAILQRYPVLSKKSTFITILTILGAVLIGLGTLLFVGANWSAIPHLFKLLLILAATIVSYATGWHLSYAAATGAPADALPTHPKLGGALLLLGSIFYGAGIWLVAQMLNLDMSLETGLVLWGLGAGAMTLVTRQTAVASLTALISLVWLVANEGHHWSLFSSSSARNGADWIGFGLSVGSMLVLSHIVRSRTALIITLVGGALWTGFACSQHLYAIGIYGAILLIAHLWYRTRNPLFANAFFYAGAVITPLTYFLMTFDHYNAASRISSLNNLDLLTLGGTTFAVAALVAFKTKVAKEELLLGLLAAVGCAFLQFVGNDFFSSVLSNLAFAALLVGMIAVGMRTNRPGLVNTAMVFVVLDIVARYFDFFFSMLDRSLFFVMGGVVLMVAGAIVEKNRRRMFNRTAHAS
jgi:uncharacterized membrane protein